MSETNTSIVEVKQYNPNVGVAEVPEAATPLKKRKVYCSFGHTGECNWILPLNFEITQLIEDADVVVFGGGKDIDPGFYNEKRGPRTDRPNERDRQEKEDFNYVQKINSEGGDVKVLGICRGAQLICALSGGSLIQDVGGHCGTHSVSTFDKKELQVNSIHHQMLFPYNMEKRNYKILGWSTRNISSHYLNGWNKVKWLPVGFKELEVVYFPQTRALAIQSHPEMMYRTARYDETVKWMQDLFLKFFNNKL